jgi:hypothetical protein
LHSTLLDRGPEDRGPHLLFWILLDCILWIPQLLCRPSSREGFVNLT